MGTLLSVGLTHTVSQLLPKVNENRNIRRSTVGQVGCLQGFSEFRSQLILPHGQADAVLFLIHFLDPDSDHIAHAEQPFAVNVNLDCQNAENLRFETKVSASNVNATIDAEKIYASSNLDVRVVAYEDMCERVLSSSVRLDDMPVASCGSTVTVYYPTKDDTLFSVAKKYHTSAASIASGNSLTESVLAGGEDGSLAGVKKLIIF